MIQLNNKDYNFKFGFKAIVLMEEETGKSFSSIGEEFKFGDIVDLCYYGIKATGADITKDEIVDAIDNDPSLFKTINEAVGKDMAAFNQLEEEAKK